MKNLMGVIDYLMEIRETKNNMEDMLEITKHINTIQGQIAKTVDVEYYLNKMYSSEKEVKSVQRFLFTYVGIYTEIYIHETAVLKWYTLE